MCFAYIAVSLLSKYVHLGMLDSIYKFLNDSSWSEFRRENCGINVTHLDFWLLSVHV